MGKRVGVVAVGVLALSVSGCAWWAQRSRTVKGAVYGTGAGAATGAAVGAVLGGGEGAWKGAAVGAVLGGLAGTAIGHYMDKQAAEMEKILAEQDRLRREGETLHVALSSDILFRTGSAELAPGARDKLRRLAAVLNRYPRTRIQIVGHTDSRGSEKYNLELSRRRAEAVRDALAGEGVDPARMEVSGMGESRPVATNDTPTGRAMNRRVELTLVPDESLRAEQGRGAAPAAPQPGAAEPH